MPGHVVLGKLNSEVEPIFHDKAKEEGAIAITSAETQISDFEEYFLADYQKENELGRRSIIDLLNIELEYNAARNRKVTADYDNILSYYQILSYTGKMLEEMNVVIK